ncbi:ABC transporter ATP-binding protein [Magnetococcus sp. PR-3]|uniref:ABC transporter ATP-binding protein n=1 Tax=Magnetococcus sp. PR-3 TaxID=3120355 RepID=UPI002FCE00B0
MSSLLRTDHLTKSFGGVSAIFELSFAVEQGGIFSVIGPNGAGKTTLFNLLSGIYTPSSGQIFYNDQAVVGAEPHTMAAMGISRTFQTPQIFFNMSALENVLVGRHRHGQAGFWAAALRLPSAVKEDRLMQEQARDALAFCGLSHLEGRDADALPYGELKRLEVARALASEPKLLLMDEPAAGLNDTETAVMGALIEKLAQSGITVMLVEHNMELVMGISQQLLVLDFGSKLAEGSPAEIRDNPRVIEAYLGDGALTDGL